MDDLTDQDYLALHEFRHAIRHFLRFSEEAARAAGVEPQQHQLMLAIRAGNASGVAELAERLQLRHHSTVELIDRLVARGLASRHRSQDDRRHVIVELTAEGERVLHELSVFHRDQLRTEGPALIRALEAISPLPAARR